MIDLTFAIQAGGHSIRMGQDKALMSFSGKTIIEHILSRIINFFIPDEILIVTDHHSQYSFLTKRYPIRFVSDILPGKGALGGIYTSLKEANLPLVSIVACDLPFFNPAIIMYGFDYMNQSGGDAFIPHSSKGLEPLCAVYRCNTCLPYIKQSLEHNNLKVTSWFSHVNIREWKVPSTDEIYFFNVNTPREFEQANELALLNPDIITR